MRVAGGEAERSKPLRLEEPHAPSGGELDDRRDRLGRDRVATIDARSERHLQDMSAPLVALELDKLGLQCGKVARRQAYPRPERGPRGELPPDLVDHLQGTLAHRLVAPRLAHLGRGDKSMQRIAGGRPVRLHPEVAGDLERPAHFVPSTEHREGPAPPGGRQKRGAGHLTRLEIGESLGRSPQRFL